MCDKMCESNQIVDILTSWTHAHPILHWHLDHPPVPLLDLHICHRGYIDSHMQITNRLVRIMHFNEFPCLLGCFFLFYQK